jgi:hypothetical protein
MTHDYSAVCAPPDHRAVPGGGRRCLDVFVQSASPAASGTAAPSAIALLSPTPSQPATVDMESSCSFKLTKGDLPVWAREGFSPPFNATPFVTSKRGDLIGVVFGYPLKSPRVKPNDGNNKILWVSQEHAGQIEVYAQLVGSSQVVDIGYIPVGPSIIDVPKPGCWHLTLHGLGWTDTIDLVYNKD